MFEAGWTSMISEVSNSRGIMVFWHRSATIRRSSPAATPPAHGRQASWSTRHRQVSATTRWTLLGQWTRLKRALVGHRNPGLPRAQSRSGLLSVLLNAPNGGDDVVLRLFTTSAALTDGQLDELRSGYSTTHERSRWESV